MIIAKNDEEKRSRIWRIVTTVSSALIVIIGIYLLTKMFTTNPLEGEWIDENGTFSYSVDKKQLTLSEREYGEQMIFTKK